MVIIGDEQIITAVCLLNHWTKVTSTYMDTLFSAIYNQLLALHIMYRRDYKTLEDFAKKYPTYYKMEGNVLNLIAKEQLAFDAFLATLPDEVKSAIATVLKTTN